MDDYTILVVRRVLLDIIILAGLGICLFSVNNFWTPYQRGFFCGDETLMYPFKKDTVSSDVLHAYGIIIPLITILICEWVVLRKAKGEDRECFGIRIPGWLRGMYSVGVSFGFGTVAVEFIVSMAKKTIGRLRPCFFDVCVPSIDCTNPSFMGRYVNASEYNCTGILTDQFKQIRLSFASGHSSWAAFSMIFVVLYLEKRMQWRGSRLVRHTLQLAALLLSWFTALSRVTDNRHHWSDVVAGYSIGVVGAILVVHACTDWIGARKHSALPQHETQAPRPLPPVYTT